jgi:hypothetical protein
MDRRHLHGRRHSPSHLVPRIPSPEPDAFASLESREAMGVHDVTSNTQGSIGLLARATAPKSEEKTGGPNMSLVIGLCVAIPIVLSLGVLFFLHRRNQKRLAIEDADDKYRSMDFGLGEHNPAKGGKRKSAFFGSKEKGPGHNNQLSMDMNLSSPYLLPPTLQHSRESMNSLAKSLHAGEDPYRSAVEYAQSDVGSMRSYPKSKDRGSSVYTPQSRSPPNSRPAPPGGPLRQDLQASAPPQAPPATHSPPSRASPEDMSPPVLPVKNEFRFTDDEPSRPDAPPMGARQEELPTIHEPPAAAQKSPQVGVLDTVRPMSNDSSRPSDRSSNPHSARGSQQSMTRPPRKSSMPAVAPNAIHEYQEYAQHLQLDGSDHDQHPHEERGRTMPQGEQDYPRSAGLGLPEQDTRRLSVGFRPLPPDEYLDSEDPEFRANRIRSFYKEYFDDSGKGAAPGRPPPGGEYYEDYDSNYLGDAAYFDPETNAFIMPYAEPVQRRAMTPPPNSRRPMPGPRQRGPPGRPGPGGPPGRPRAGSTMSAGQWGPGSPRPGSSASQPRFGAKPRKNLPPPAALNTLPTPSKLRDDSFAITGAIDFAPPPTFKDQANGRSQSPMGERVPYNVHTPAHSPLIGAYDETAALPSPHLLRKSGTFTGLDFAPPRRFKDPEAMSDAGSIRSNRSGLSSKHAFALRNGAGRVSRLPGDTVFTQADLGNNLKPQWGMRP